MAWDPNRRVPWQRLSKEWLIYLVIISIVFGLFFSDSVNLGTVVGLALSGPIYVGFGAVMAKFGYERQRLIKMPRPAPTSTRPTSATRKPAPTSRTGARKGRKSR